MTPKNVHWVVYNHFHIDTIQAMDLMNTLRKDT